MATKYPPIRSRNIAFVNSSFGSLTGRSPPYTREIDLIDAPVQCALPMKVLCLGWSRTGTLSLMAALGQLGYRPYHMAAAYPNAHEEFPCWTEALQLKFGLKPGTPWGRAEFDKMTGGYDCVLDVPCILFAEEMITAYPEAKVILTHRPVEDWISSMRTTVGTVMPWPLWRLLAWADPELAHPWYIFVRFMIYLVLNRQQHWDMSLTDTAAMTGAYTSHYALVRKLMPEDLLLELELGAGDEWGKLCMFLGHEVPKGNAKAYPRVNDKRFFIAFRKRMLWRAGWWAVQKVLVAGVLCGLVLAVGVWCYCVEMARRRVMAAQATSSSSAS